MVGVSLLEGPIPAHPTTTNPLSIVLRLLLLSHALKDGLTECSLQERAAREERPASEWRSRVTWSGIRLVVVWCGPFSCDHSIQLLPTTDHENHPPHSLCLNPVPTRL